jgi:Domain of unknown function (DUF5060)
MRVLFALVLLLATPTLPLLAQSNPCLGTVTWSACDWSFDLAPSENPDTFELHAEFRSPRSHTFLLHAFRDGDRHFLIRFAPTEEGDWNYRFTSNLPRLQGQTGQFNAEASASPGFVKTANVHHFATANGKPHLWMASALDDFLSLPRDEFERTVAARANDKFTHLRVTIPSNADLDEAAERIRSINTHGVVADLVFASIPANAQSRRKYISDLASRFAALNITWMGLAAFESVPNARAILKDTGEILKQFDPYNHPRTSLAESTSGALGNDPWTSVLSYGTCDPNVGAVEHQLYGDPAINTGIHSERDLWIATMNGQYPASGYGAYMTAWFNFMSGNRFWELEPYFDVDGGRALALEDVEYIVYVEKPGPVEITVADHSYDVAWINPATGDRVKGKGYRGQHFIGDPPDKSHDWVLHISREGEKQSRLKSYFFDSREQPIQLQQVQFDPEKTPYEVSAPTESEISFSGSPRFALRVTRNSRATRTLLVEWAGEVTAEGQGYRVIGSGVDGNFQIPESMTRGVSPSMLVHVFVMNAFGKVYELDKVYRLAP